MCLEPFSSQTPRRTRDLTSCHLAGQQAGCTENDGNPDEALVSDRRQLDASGVIGGDEHRDHARRRKHDVLEMSIVAVETIHQRVLDDLEIVEESMRRCVV